MQKYALISVSDKTGIVEFAQKLVGFGFTILSTGGTADALVKAGIAVTTVSDFTGFPEIMDGRVKTLQPKIHGALLGVRDNPVHVAEAEAQGISWIDLVVINLYPFAQTIAKPGVELAEAIEQIDIGGPSMIRSAAKNSRFVGVVVDPNDYAEVVNRLETGRYDEQYRLALATRAFRLTSGYDEMIAQYLSDKSGEPEFLSLHYQKVGTLRYGENPHQKAAFFRNPYNHDANIANAEILGGKELSFNNIVDADSAIELVKEFERPAAVFIKHNNPCGVAVSDRIEVAFELGHQVDPLSAFGCVIALNTECNQAICDYIDANKMFVEIIAAPSFSAEAVESLQKRPNLRILKTGKLQIDPNRRDIKKVAGGILVQTADTYLVGEKDLKVVTELRPTAAEIKAMLFAQRVCKHVKSNAVVFAKVDSDGNEVVTGIGAGQMSRVDSVMIATRKGGERIAGSVMASDAFFPFSDAVTEAASHGVAAILQPGGSIRDEEVIAEANKLGLKMVFTGIRNFRH